MRASLLAHVREQIGSAGAWVHRQAMTGPTWLRVTGLGLLLFAVAVLWMSKLLALVMFGAGGWLLVKPWSPPGATDSYPRARAAAVPPWEEKPRP